MAHSATIVKLETMLRQVLAQEARKKQKARTPALKVRQKVQQQQQQGGSRAVSGVRVKEGKRQTKGAAPVAVAAHRAPREGAGKTRLMITQPLKKAFRQLDIRGHGGFQSFCTNLRGQILGAEYLVMDRELFNRIIRYATEYGEGGFQQRLRMLLALWTAQHSKHLLKD